MSSFKSHLTFSERPLAFWNWCDKGSEVFIPALLPLSPVCFLSSVVSLCPILKLYASLIKDLSCHVLSKELVLYKSSPLSSSSESSLSSSLSFSDAPRRALQYAKREHMGGARQPRWPRSTHAMLVCEHLSAQGVNLPESPMDTWNYYYMG